MEAFAKVPRKILREEKLDPESKMLLWAIIDAEPCYLTLDGFEERTGISRNTIQRRLKSLAESGHIRRIHLNRRRCFTVSRYQDDFLKPSLPKESGLYFKKNRATVALTENSIGPNQGGYRATMAPCIGPPWPSIDTPYRYPVIEQNHADAWEDGNTEIAKQGMSALADSLKGSTVEMTLRKRIKGD